MDIMAQHLAHLRAGEPFLKPVYRHDDGTFGPPSTSSRRQLHGRRGPARLPHRGAARLYDVRVFLAPPEELRRKWKVERDCSRRGYTTDQVLAELDRREPDSDAFIRPQQPHADIVVSFLPEGADDQEHLDAELMLRDGLPHPDLAPLRRDGDARGITLTRARRRAHVLHPGRHRPRARRARSRSRSGTRMHFASHLRTERLGEFTIGTDLHRSESLALVQLLILYHLFTARAASRSAARAARRGRSGARGRGDPADHQVAAPGRPDSLAVSYGCDR